MTSRYRIIPMTILVLLFAAAPVKAARVHRKAQLVCQAGRERVIAADSRAQIYETMQGEDRIYRGCVYGRQRSFLLDGPVVCGGGSTATCGGARHIVLAGTVAAYETVSVENKYGQSPEDEWMIVVRDLRTGATDIGREHHTLEGPTLYWTQTGKPFAAPLN